MQNCKELREAKTAKWNDQRLSAADLATLGTLGSVLPALKELCLIESTGAVHNGVQRLAAGLGAGALPTVTYLTLSLHVGDTGASALAAALSRGALPRLKVLKMFAAAIGDAGLVALALALRRRPALQCLYLQSNPLGDEGLAALVAPLPAGALPSPPTISLPKLKRLRLRETQVTDAGCATLAAALHGGALPALETLYLDDIPASAAAIATVYEARASLKGGGSEHEAPTSESEEEEDE